MSDRPSFAAARRDMGFAFERKTSLCEPFLAVLPVTGAAVSILGRGQSTVNASDETAAWLDELQIDLGEGPCWDAMNNHEPVLRSTLTAENSRDWPMFTEAILDHERGRRIRCPGSRRRRDDRDPSGAGRSRAARGTRAAAERTRQSNRHRAGEGRRGAVEGLGHGFGVPRPPGLLAGQQRTAQRRRGARCIATVSHLGIAFNRCPRPRQSQIPSDSEVPVNTQSVDTQTAQPFTPPELAAEALEVADLDL